MITTNPHWPRHAFVFKGGGGGVTQQVTQIESAPVPLPAPPVTSTNTSVIQAQQEAARDNLLKKSVKKTIFAGDTGGFGGGGAAPKAGPASAPKY